MEKKIISLIILLSILFVFSTKIYCQTTNSKAQTKMETNQKTETQIFIDKFFVPKSAKQEFDEKTNKNRNLLHTLSGFIEDNVYERTDENGDFIIITVAVWKDAESIKKAKEAVQAEYKKEGFDMQGILKHYN